MTIIIVYMSFQTRGVCKLQRTQRARKVVYATVRRHVTSEIAFRQTTLSTNLTLLRIAAPVSRFVQTQEVGAGEAATTVQTCVFHGVKLWNSLSNNLRDCNSVTIFKKNLKKYLISIY